MNMGWFEWRTQVYGKMPPDIFGQFTTPGPRLLASAVRYFANSRRTATPACRGTAIRSLRRAKEMAIVPQMTSSRAGGNRVSWTKHWRGASRKERYENRNALHPR